MKKECKHDFREFWKTNYWGRLVLKEVKCIMCKKLKKMENQNSVCYVATIKEVRAIPRC
jgi:hypothetical protein